MSITLPCTRVLAAANASLALASACLGQAGDPRPVPNGLTIGGITFSPSRPRVGQRVTFTVVLVNGSSETLSGGLPRPGTVYRQMQTYPQKGWRGRPGTYRVGLDYAGRNWRENFPFRWGLGRAVGPGETVSVRGVVVFQRAGTYSFTAGLERVGTGLLDMAGPRTQLRVSGAPRRSGSRRRNTRARRR